MLLLDLTKIILDVGIGNASIIDCAVIFFSDVFFALGGLFAEKPEFQKSQKVVLQCTAFYLVHI